MRLTCPNCGAQYEVPDQVIPLDGRDVQCSNCGNTWFQAHPDNPEPEFDADLQDDPTPDWSNADEGQDAGYDDGSDPYDEPDAYPETEPFAEPEPVQQGLDNSVTDVLREEAERETRLRAEEAAEGLQSQPDLGLDNSVDDARRRADEARERMARLRGDPAENTSEPDDLDPDIESRRGLLPDIEEINSTLKNTGGNIAPTHSSDVPRSAAPKKSSGFSRGFALAMVLAVILLLLYTNAPRISAAVPQLDPALNSYVATVDKGRFWLDQQIRQLTPDPAQ